MIKFATACGSGLGSSFMLEMNIETVLKELKIDSSQVEVEHYDMGSTAFGLADVWFVGADLEDAAKDLGDVRVLKSIIDMNELREKVKQACKDKGLI
ncbi:PTS system IIB component, L-Asc family [Carnobacterium alterfunditum]|uniref:PTS system IIB component, L-Asc family n=1 Tax=Carnobacterium alterfunditum TaxID=28230 RepID=A0A1N6EU63_9LACT|nr:PTS sugar transporter subunit IIB [Carnobacterium alterfunditum]SIN86530.1 PTS system IIB component, L-Asc family [Carnobacterium alterfunditum]